MNPNVYYYELSFTKAIKLFDYKKKPAVFGSNKNIELLFEE